MSADIQVLPVKGGRAEAQKRPAPQYECLRCHKDDFKLFSDGRVRCASCGALTRNLFVEMR